MLMNPYLLRTFVAVARRASFSAAADDLGYTQSAVSQQVAALEADLGVALLRRRPVAPTEAGERLLAHAGPILLRLDAARADVRRLSGVPATEVRLGATALAATGAAVAALVGAGRAMARVAFALRVAGPGTVTAAVATGALDLGLVDGVAAPGDPLPLPDAGPLTVRTVTEQPVVVALPATHPLAGRAAVRLEALADAAWLDAPDLAPPRDQLRAVARTDGFGGGLRYDGTDVRTLLDLVAAGAGLALLPARVVRAHAGLVGIPVAAPPVVHRTELVHSALTAPVRTLADALTP
jgi:DNA-binding transcriptional LysR family regulator